MMNQHPIQGGITETVISFGLMATNGSYTGLTSTLQTSLLITKLFWDPVIHCRKWSHHQIHSL